MACCVISSVNAQYIEKEADIKREGDDFLQESYIGLNLGFSTPTGDYGSDSRSNQDAAYAETGYHISVTYNKLMSENVGFAFLLGRSAHNMNDEELESFLQETFPISGNPPHNLVDWSVSAGSFSTTSIMGGILFAFPLENGFFDVRCLVGYASSTLPAVRISLTDGNIFEEQVHKSSTKGAMAFNLGAGVRLNLNEYLAMSLNIDWYTTKPTFDQVVESNFGYSANETYSISMTMLNPSIGIGYRFY